MANWKMNECISFDALSKKKCHLYSRILCQPRQKLTKGDAICKDTQNDYYLFTECTSRERTRDDSLLWLSFFAFHFSISFFNLSTHKFYRFFRFWWVSCFLSGDHNKSKIVRLIIHFTHPICSSLYICTSDCFCIDMQTDFFVVSPYFYCVAMSVRAPPLHYYVIHKYFHKFF